MFFPDSSLLPGQWLRRHETRAFFLFTKSFFLHRDSTSGSGLLFFPPPCILLCVGFHSMCVFELILFSSGSESETSKREDWVFFLIIFFTFIFHWFVIWVFVPFYHSTGICFSYFLVFLLIYFDIYGRPWQFDKTCQA